MPQVFLSLVSLLLGFGLLLIGNGLLSTLLGVRANMENFPQVVTGIFMAAYFAGFILGSFYCPALIRRVGHIRAFAALSAVSAATAIVHALVVDPVVWTLLRVIMGGCLMGLYLVVESWLIEVAVREIHGKVFAIYIMISLICFALGQYLILAGDIQGTVLFAIASMLFILGLVPIALTKLREPVLVSNARLEIKRLYEISPVGVLGTLTAGLANGAFFGMGAVFAHSIGLSKLSIAGFMSAVILGGAFLQWPIGQLSDQHDRRAVLTYVCFASATLAVMSFFASAYSMYFFMICAFLYGGHALAVYSLSIAHTIDVIDKNYILEATRGMLLVYGIGAVIGPFLVGLFMNIFGPSSMLAYFAITLGALGLFTLYRMSRRASVPVNMQEPFVPLLRTSEAILDLYPEAILDHTATSRKEKT